MGKPFLISAHMSDEDYDLYVADNGGYTPEWQPPEEVFVSTPASEKALPAEQVSPSSGPPPSAVAPPAAACTSKTEYRPKQKKLGSYPLAELISKAVPVRNVGGSLWFRRDPSVYRPMSERDVITLLRNQKLLPTDSAQVERLSKDILTCLKSIPELEVSELPVYKGRILFRNVWYDVAQDKVITPTEDHIITHKIDVTLHDKRLKTPVWDAFLESLSDGDQSIKDLVLSMIGYCMLPEQDAKVFFVLGTAPDSGKSILGSFLQRLIGPESTSAVSLHSLRSDFSLAPIIGKKLNIAMDLPADTLKVSAVGNIKTVTGDDLVSINIKFMPHVQQRVTTKFVFGTNFPILLDKPDSAFYRRMVLIPFLRSIPTDQQDHNLLEKLWAEREGIAQQGVLAARKLIANNYEFPYCKQAENMVRRWSQSDDHHVLDFVRDWCVCGDLTIYSGVTGLHLAYVHYCAQNGFDPVGVSKFSRILNNHASSLGIRKRHKNTGSWFDGIELHPNLQLPPEIRMKVIMPD